jgi:hypothetical protein
MKIISATVLLTNGADRVSIIIDKPPPMIHGERCLVVDFIAGKDYGVDYCRKILGIPEADVEVIDSRYRGTQFSKEQSKTKGNE